jgi:hypothetical protein
MSVSTARPDLAEPRVRRLVLIAAVALMTFAGALGWVLGGILHSKHAGATTLSDRVVSAGDARVLVDGNWAPAPAGKELAATAGLTDLTSFAPLPGLPGQTWVARAALDGPTLLPAGLRARVSTLPAPVKTKLAGRPAWRYPAMKLRSGGLLEVTAAPTLEGVLLAGCEAGPASWSTVVGCGNGIHGVTGPAPLVPSAGLAFHARLKPVVARLDAARAAAGGALRRAGRASGQQAAAQKLADAHRSAARALSPLAPAKGAERAAVQRLGAAAFAYRTLAKAAGRRDRRAYGRARAAVGRTNRALRQALATAAR